MRSVIAHEGRLAMIWFVGQVVVVGALFLGTSLAGRALQVVFGPSFLRSRSPEQLALSPVIGTAAWVLLFGSLSYLGLRAGIAASIVLSTSFLLAVYTRKEFAYPLRWHGGLMVLGGSCAVAVVLCLLPILLHNIYYPYNDTWTYIVLSDWLQQHGFGQPAANDPYQPLLAQVRVYQIMHYRLGPIFFLALTQAAMFVERALTIYPAVMAWGFVLLSLALFVFARWCIRLRFNFAVALVAYVAVTMNPIRWAATNGFLPQIYGTAALLVCIALMARMVQRGNWSVHSALLLGFLGAFLISTYSEMFPVLSLVSLVYVAIAFRHGLRHKACFKLVRFLGVAVLSFVVFANLEVVRAYYAIQSQMNMFSGWHIDLTLGGFWSAAMGQYLYSVYPYPKPIDPYSLLSRWAPYAAIPMTAFFALGLQRLVKRDRSRLVRATIVIFLVMLINFGFSPTNVFTGKPIHPLVIRSFIIFKIIQWSFPVIAVAQFAGLELVGLRLVRLFGNRRLFHVWLPLGVLSTLVVVWAPIHVAEADQAKRSLRIITGSKDPFGALSQLGGEIDSLKWDCIWLLPSAKETWGSGMPYLMVAYFLAPRPIAGDWRGSGSYVEGGYDPRVLPVQPKGNSLKLLIGKLPFGGQAKRLPGNVTLLEERPYIISLNNQNGLEHAADGSSLFWMGQGTTTLKILSPRKMIVRIEMALSPGPSVPETPSRRLRVEVPGAFVKTVTISSYPKFEILLPIDQGITNFNLTPLDQASLAKLPNGDTRPLLLQAKHIRIEQME